MTITITCRCGRSVQSTGGGGGLPAGWHHVVLQHYRRVSSWIDRVTVTYCPACWADPGNTIAVLVREAQTAQASEGRPRLP
jgi:hypothetical protein